LELETFGKDESREVKSALCVDWKVKSFESILERLQAPTQRKESMCRALKVCVYKRCRASDVSGLHSSYTRIHTFRYTPQPPPAKGGILIMAEKNWRNCKEAPQGSLIKIQFNATSGRDSAWESISFGFKSRSIFNLLDTFLIHTHTHNPFRKTPESKMYEFFLFFSISFSVIWPFAAAFEYRSGGFIVKYMTLEVIKSLFTFHYRHIYEAETYFSTSLSRHAL